MVIPFSEIVVEVLRQNGIEIKEKKMTKGKITRLAREKGFGFIRVTGQNDVFFHRSGIKNALFEELNEGMDVEFELTNPPKGPRAENITVLIEI